MRFCDAFMRGGEGGRKRNGYQMSAVIISLGNKKKEETATGGSPPGGIAAGYSLSKTTRGKVLGAARWAQRGLAVRGEM